MLRFNAKLFIDVANLLREMEALAKIASGYNMAVPVNDVRRVREIAVVLQTMCDLHGWVSPSKKCARIVSKLREDGDVLQADLHTSLQELRERIEDELESHHFLHLHQSEAERFASPTKHWEEVETRFPLLRINIEESSKCFALQRYGAAVFHVVLVAEYGVIAIAKLMNVAGDKPGWGQLAKLEKLIEVEYPKRDAHTQQHSKLLEAVVPLATVVKDSWRHKLTHVDNQLVWVDTDFGPNVAEEIITATRGFMRRLASELPVENDRKE